MPSPDDGEQDHDRNDDLENCEPLRQEEGPRECEADKDSNSSLQLRLFPMQEYDNSQNNVGDTDLSESRYPRNWGEQRLQVPGKVVLTDQNIEKHRRTGTAQDSHNSESCVAEHGGPEQDVGCGDKSINRLFRQARPGLSSGFLSVRQSGIPLVAMNMLGLLAGAVS